MTDIAALEADLRRACDDQSYPLAATLAIRGYGPELLGYLNAMLRSPSDADDVFSTVCEHVWNGVARFSWQSTFRTWVYAVTRNACISFVRSSRTKRAVQLSTNAFAAVAQEVRTQTASFLLTGAKDRLADIRAALDPDDQTLLILRVDRQLPWREIADVFEGSISEAALRKRFERLKEQLKLQLQR